MARYAGRRLMSKESQRIDLAVMRYLRFHTMRPSGPRQAEQVTLRLGCALRFDIGDRASQPYHLIQLLRRLKKRGYVHYESTHNAVLVLRLAPAGRRILQDEERREIMEASA